MGVILPFIYYFLFPKDRPSNWRGHSCWFNTEYNLLFRTSWTLKSRMEYLCQQLCYGVLRLPKQITLVQVGLTHLIRVTPTSQNAAMKVTTKLSC